MTTPSVLATHTRRGRLGAVRRRVRASAGATRRDSACRLAPTEPFIGASSAPTESADISAAAPLRANSALAGAVQELGERQPVEQRADQRVERQRLQEVVLEQADDAAGSAPRIGQAKAPRRDAEHAPNAARRAEQHGVDRQAGRDHERRSRRRTCARPSQLIGASLGRVAGARRRREQREQRLHEDDASASSQAAQRITK